MLHRIIRGEHVISATIRISIALLLMHKKMPPYWNIPWFLDEFSSKS
jgi:hypothetical protein